MPVRKGRNLYIGLSILVVILGYAGYKMYDNARVHTASEIYESKPCGRVLRVSGKVMQVEAGGYKYWLDDGTGPKLIVDVAEGQKPPRVDQALEVSVAIGCSFGGLAVIGPIQELHRTALN